MTGKGPHRAPSLRSSVLARPLVVATLASLAAAAGTWLVLSIYWPADAGRPADIKVRWAPTVATATRTSLEQQLGLRNGVLDERTTWVYRLADTSRSNVRALVTNPAVEDTQHVNRLRFTTDVNDAAERRRRLRIGTVSAAVAVALFAVLLQFVGLTSRRVPGTSRDSADRGEHQRPHWSQLPRVARWWPLIVLIVSAPLVASIAVALWKTPFPISETVSVVDAAINSLPAFLDPRQHSWYRPLYYLTWSLLWQSTSSLHTTLFLFRILEVASVAALVVLVVAYFRPRTLLDAALATFAIAVLLGSPALRDNLEIPLLMTLVAMPLAVALWMLVECEHRWWHGMAIVALVVLAVGFKEQGLVFAPLIVVAWWGGAPGVSRRTMLAVVALTAAYLAGRFSTRGTWQPFEQAIALGFTTIEAADANARFGNGPVPIYAYNVLATMASLLFGEPTSGEFRAVYSVLYGRLQSWQVIQVLSSTALTGVIVWWAVQLIRRDWKGQRWTAESRLCAAFVVALVASGALGFNYSRERLGGMALVFYAMAAYCAVGAWVRSAWTGAAVRVAVTSVSVALLATAWQTRALGTIDYACGKSEKSQREWMTAPHERRVFGEVSPAYLSIFEALKEQGLDPSAARRYPLPDWAAELLGER